jgi:hypothetical protein
MDDLIAQYRKNGWDHAVEMIENHRRYAWLKSQPCGAPFGLPKICIPRSDTAGDFVNGEDADKAIDAALKQSPAGETK